VKLSLVAASLTTQGLEAACWVWVPRL